MSKLLRRLRLPSVRVLPPLAVVVGLGVALSGVYLLTGLAVTLLAGGAVLVVGGLLVDL